MRSQPTAPFPRRVAASFNALRDATDWVLSYDRSPVIEDLYAWAERYAIGSRYSVQGKKKEWASSAELGQRPGKRSHAGHRDAATCLPAKRSRCVIETQGEEVPQ